MDNYGISHKEFDNWEDYPDQIYTEEELNLLWNDKLWVMCQTSKYGDPNIYKVNQWLSDEETIGYTEYFCGAECTGSIARSKSIMYGTFQDLHKKLNDYKAMRDLIETAKESYNV